MIKILLGLCFLSSALFALDWVKDLDTAFATAQKEKKIVMVMVEGENCRWCKKMKHRTLGDEGVEKRLERFIIVKVMRENHEVMKALPKISGVPTVFFMKSDKTVLEEVIGYFDVLDFTSYIGDVEKKVKQK